MKVTDYTVDGKCSGCGECCSDLLPMSEREVRRIKTYIKKNGIKEQRHNAASGIDMTCPFRDRVNRKCLIYPVRPEVCREFVCNCDKDKMLKKRNSFHRKYPAVAMRNKFFGSTEEIKYLTYVMKNITKSIQEELK